MSLRPVDLQVLLNQMSEVGRKEKKREDKRTEEKQDKDERLKAKQLNYNIEIADVDKVEISEKSSQRIQKTKGKKKEKKDHGKEDSRRPGVDGKLKGNFIDIRE